MTRWSKIKEVLAGLVYEIVQIASTFIVFPLTLAALGPDDYGRYITVYTIAGFAITWVYASVGVALAQLVLQRHRTIESAIKVGHRQVLLFAIPASLIGLVITALTLGNDMIVVALVIFGTDLAIAGIADVLISVLYSQKGVPASARIRLLNPLLRAIGVGALALFDGITILSLVLVNLVATVAIYLAARHRVRTLEQETPTDGSVATPRELFRLSFTYAMSMSTNAVQNDGDKMVLAAYRSNAEVGEYGAAYRLVSTAMLPLRAVSTAATRWFLPNDAGTTTQLKRAIQLLIPTGAYAALCGVGLLIVQPISGWLMGDEFEHAVQITVWLAGFPLARVVSDLPTYGLLGLGRNRARMFLGLAGALVSAAAYLLMVPPWGWRGAVVATYLSEIFVAIVGWTLLVRYQRLDGARAVEVDDALATTPTTIVD